MSEIRRTNSARGACCALLLLLCASACWADETQRLAVAGLAHGAEAGIFDPSFTRDDQGRMWMSFSTVSPDPTYGTKFNFISTRLAMSKDNGATWTDQGAVNPATDQPLPPPHDRLKARWEHEVSRVLYDPYAETGTRWKLLWHRVLRVYDGKSPDSAPLFEHGWMELRTAPDAVGPWSRGRKMFVGFAYNDDNDNNLGAPEMRLNKMKINGVKMKGCAAYTEPGMVAREAGIYVALRCATGKPNGQIALLLCDHEFRDCDYRGPLLKDEEAPRFGGRLSGFSGSDLVDTGDKVYLVVTPTEQPGEIYRGCLFFEVVSLDQATINPEPALRVDGKPGSFNGACGYAGKGSAGGVYLSEYSPEGPAHFRVFKTGVAPP